MIFVKRTCQGVGVVKNNLWFGENPLEFVRIYEKEQEVLRQHIIQARNDLVNVTVQDEILNIVVRSCIVLNVDGHRPDIATVRAAKTLAALEGHKDVTIKEVLTVAGMAIGFRTRRGGFEEPATVEEVEQTFTQIANEYL